MADVRAAYLQGGAGAGEGFEVPVLSLSGNFPATGVAPGSFVVEVPALNIIGDGRGFPGAAPGGGVTTGPGSGAVGSTLTRFFDPDQPKSMFGGNNLDGMRFNELYIETSDPSEIRDVAGRVTVQLQDRRIWWHRRGSMGPRAWNLDQWGERPSPFAPITGSTATTNPRYNGHSHRTVEQMFGDIFNFLGETVGDIHLRANSLGFADLSSILVEGSRGTTIPILNDTPPFIIGEGEKAVSALDRLAALYDLAVAISPDTRDVGFIPLIWFAERLRGSLDLVEMIKAGDPDQVPGASVGWDRESTPEYVEMIGAPILIGDYYTIEPVCRNPDSEHDWIPLYREDTLRAYGVDLERPGRRHLRGQNGQALAGIIHGLAAGLEPCPEIPPRLHGFVREWHRVWQIAMPRETTEDVPASVWPAVMVTRDNPERPWPRGAARDVVEDDPSTGINYSRRVSPAYRFRRGPLPGGATRTVNGRTLWDPSNTLEVAELHRPCPILDHTEVLYADGSTGRMQVYGANVLVPVQPVSQAGVNGSDWFDVGPLVVPGGMSTERQHLDPLKLSNIGANVTLIDAANGVVDLGMQVFGHNGAAIQRSTKTRRYFGLSEEGVAGSTIRHSDVTVRRSRASDALSQQANGRGVTLTDLWYREQRCHAGEAPAPKGFSAESGGAETGEPEVGTEEGAEPAECLPSPLGIPYLLLHAASPKRSHGDDRDTTMSYGQTGFAKADPLFADRVLPAMLTSIHTQAPVAPPPTGASSRGGAAEIWSYDLPDVQLRCRTARMAGTSSPRHSFHRQGGWTSGSLRGVNYWQDVELVARTDLRGGSADDGKFYPVTRAHYDEIFRLWQDILAKVTASVVAWRQTGNHQRTLNAEIMGWRRDMLPGTALYANNPFDIMAVQGSGDGADASCRVTCNSRGFRPFVGSAIERGLMAYMAASVQGLHGMNAHIGGE